MKITKDMIDCAYEVAKEVYSGSITREEGKEKIACLSGMNLGSANNYIQIIQCMLKGKVYKRAMSIASTEYFLEQIGKDFGRERQIRAAEAVLAHTEYYALHCVGKQVSTSKLAKAYLE